MQATEQNIFSRTGNVVIYEMQLAYMINTVIIVD